MKNQQTKPKKKTLKKANPNSKDMSVGLQNHLLKEVVKYADQFENGITVSEVLRGLGLMVVGYSNLLIQEEEKMPENNVQPDKNIN